MIGIKRGGKEIIQAEKTGIKRGEKETIFMQI